MSKTLASISSLVLALWAGGLLASPAGVSYQATPCINTEDFKVFIDKATDFAFV